MIEQRQNINTLYATNYKPVVFELSAKTDLSILSRPTYHVF